mmetsp:Transcript_5948/g.9286  ORF Transcript_5948/g.9286 Transcript_5948/m.9286 type:complete len:131 (+) Transcript_5948:90-482(+)
MMLRRALLPWMEGCQASWSLNKRFLPQGVDGGKAVCSSKRLQELAWLAHIELPKEGTEESRKLLEDMEGIFRFTKMVEQSQAGEVQQAGIESSVETKLRKDVINEGNDHVTVVSNASKKRDGYFVVQGRD